MTIRDTLSNLTSSVLDTASQLAIARQNAKQNQAQQETIAAPPENVPTAVVKQQPLANMPWREIAIGLGAVAALVVIFRALPLPKK